MIYATSNKLNIIIDRFQTSRRILTKDTRDITFSRKHYFQYFEINSTRVTSHKILQ